MFTTDTLNYLLFVNNRSELDDAKHHMNSEIDLNEECTIYNKKVWEGFNG